jgi:DNA polymerase
MTDERANGATLALADICWIDFETRGRVDIKTGAYRYAVDADAIILAWAIGDGPVHKEVVADFGQPLAWSDIPDELKAFYDRYEGKALFAAWNAGFDRAIWNYATSGFPELDPFDIIDVMAQAAASGLPPDLEQAAKQSESIRKDSAGSDLIKLFCLPNSVATPKSHPAEWKRFVGYAGADIEAMRSVFKGTRQLPLAEWREYWVMETINDNGICIDVPLVQQAAFLAGEDRVRSGAALQQLTGGAVTSVDEVSRITKWLLGQLPPEGANILATRTEERGEDGELVNAAKYQLTRSRVERLIAYCNQMSMSANDALPTLQAVLQVLQIRLYGGAKTPAKFSKMLASHVDGVLYGQYVFNGAAQTGRASSRGVQIHNLARDTLPYEREALELLLNSGDHAALQALGNDATPVARKLSLLIRPSLVPRGENLFLISDWSQIEARVLPWLAGEAGEHRLDIFRAVDADPSVPDLYTRSAADISHLPVGEVTKPIRQRGKVAELALGFGGGVGALQAMGAGYGLHVPDDEARVIVNRWRAANPWCVDFWDALWTAANRALEQPGATFQAGRIHYGYDPNYLGGSLFTVLPSGRLLTYRAIRYERVADVDDDGKEIGTFTTHLRFARGYARVKLWHGMLCENVVQAVAADCLRGTLRRLLDAGLNVRAHTHDECLIEVTPDAAEEAAITLRRIMQKGFPWSTGLPLMSEETAGYWYSKNGDVTWDV